MPPFSPPMYLHRRQGLVNVHEEVFFVVPVDVDGYLLGDEQVGGVKVQAGAVTDVGHAGAGVLVTAFHQVILAVAGAGEHVVAGFVVGGLGPDVRDVGHHKAAVLIGFPQAVHPFFIPEKYPYAGRDQPQAGADKDEQEDDQGRAFQPEGAVCLIHGDHDRPQQDQRAAERRQDTAHGAPGFQAEFLEAFKGCHVLCLSLFAGDDFRVTDGPYGFPRPPDDSRSMPQLLNARIAP